MMNETMKSLIKLLVQVNAIVDAAVAEDEDPGNQLVPVEGGAGRHWRFLSGFTYFSLEMKH